MNLFEIALPSLECSYSQVKELNAKLDRKEDKERALLELINLLCININSTWFIEHLRLNSLILLFQTHVHKCYLIFIETKSVNG